MNRMDLNYIESCVKQIEVIGHENQDVTVVNNSPLKMIGKGRQGAVFSIDDTKCMKIYGEPEDCDREYYAYSLGQHTSLFPKIYAKGPNYLIMEIIGGIDLREYLQSQPLTMELSKKLIDMLYIFKEIGFERIDHHKRQIYLQDDGSLKVIDVGRTVWRDRVYPYPRKLINSLGNEYKQTFLSHVRELAPDLYKEWEHFITMEKKASELSSKVLLDDIKPKKVKKMAEKLMNTKDVEKYEISIENLVAKVFKEEWVKVLLAKGMDPDEVKEKIKEYFPEDSKKDKEKYKDDGKIPSTYRYRKKKKKKD